MPIQLHPSSDPRMNNPPLFTLSNAGTSHPQTPAHSRHCSSSYRHRRAPAEYQINGSYYFEAPLRCDDRICHQTIPQHVHHAECEHSLYMNEQWRLASASTPSLASQYKTRSTVLAAKERRFISFTTLLGFLFDLFFGFQNLAKEKTTFVDSERPIGAIMNELFIDIFELLSNFLGESISAISQGIKRIDWDRVWKIVAFAYIAYVWGGKEEKRLERLGEICERRLRAGSSLNGEGTSYLLVEDVRSWSMNVWDLPGI